MCADPRRVAGRRPAGRLARRRQRGLSIVELMVGIVIAMLVSLAAAGTAMVFTASQRQGIGAGSVGMGAELALSAVKNDVALAGLGFFGDSAYLCQNLALSSGTGVVVDGTAFSPLAITPDGTSHRIDVVYADRIESGANVRLRSYDAATATAELSSLLPVIAGQAVLLAPAPGTAGTTCLVRTVTANNASTPTTPQSLVFANVAGATHNQAAFGAPPAFTAEDRIALLGDVEWTRYRRVGNTLTVERPLEGSSAVLAHNVIGIRAQYGVASAVAGSTTLESWEDPTGAFAVLGATEIPRVRALRLGIVTRSPQRQKPDAAGNCDASLAKPQLFGATVEPDVLDWQCYRYRVATVVVPMRNVVLGLRTP